MEGKTRLELAFVGFADPAVTNSGALPQYWIRKMGSNHRHSDSESDVLPTELFRNIGDRDGDRTHLNLLDRQVISPEIDTAMNLAPVTAIRHLPFRGVGGNGTDG
jgi:hypothetical protein